MTVATARKMSLDQYLNYDDGTDTRYELEDGVLVEMGAENPLNPKIASFLFGYFLQEMGVSLNLLVIGHQIGISNSKATARQPDLIIHSVESDAAIMKDGKLLRAGLPAPLLVVEITSNSKRDKRSRDRDYIQKRAEYAERQVPEYWIVDSLKQTVLVLTLVGGEYQEMKFEGETLIFSPTFSAFRLTAIEVLMARMAI